MSNASSRIQLNLFLHWHFFGRKWHVRFTNSFFSFFFTRKRFVSSCNLHHLNLDHVKLNRLCIDCVLGRKNTNGTFSSLTVSKSLQNVFKIDVIAIWRCRGKKIKETMVFFDSAVYFRTKTEEVMTLQWCAQKYSFVNKGFFSCDFFCVHSST